MPLEPGLRGRHAVVTGGGSGIGRAISLSLAAEGADVVIVGRRDHSDVVAQIAARGVRALGLQADVSRERDVVEMIARADELLDGVDIFVSVAAGTWHEPLVRLTARAWERTLATNVAACVYGCREVARLMVGRGTGGAILMVGSTALVSAQPRETSYRASKAALKAHMEVAAVELAPFGIRVNLLTPGAVDTAFVAEADPAQREHVRGQIPLRREALPDEIAPAAIFLLSDRLAGYVTGADLIVDGGLRLRPLFGATDAELRVIAPDGD